MKKHLVILSSILAITAFSGTVGASELPGGAELERIPMGSISSHDGIVYKVIDHNPSRYSKKEIGGHVVESWIENGVAYSKVDGTVTKAYKINGDLENVRVRPINSNRILEYQVVDKNPTSYQKVTTGGRVIESWIEDGVAYSKVDGTVTKAYKINGTLEKVRVRSMSSSKNLEYQIADKAPAR